MIKKNRKAKAAAKIGLKAWLRHHLEALQSALGYIAKTPLTSALMLLAMSVALALPSGLYLGVTHLLHNQGGSSNGLINAFADSSLEPAQLQHIATQLERRPDVQAVKVISKDEALKAFTELNKINNLMQTLPENPLPATLIIEVKKSSVNQQAIQAMMNDVSSIDGITQVNADLDWLDKIALLGNSLKLTSIVFGVGLAALLVLMIHIALRSEILARKDEIEVVKLVGGCEEYIQRPFIYFAALYGLFASLLAAVWLLLAFRYLQPQVDQVSAVYNQTFLLSVPFSFVAGLTLSTMIFSMMTANFTVKSLTLNTEPH